MPRRCCVPGCKANYKSTLKLLGAISAFQIPKRQELRNRWLNAISRNTWVPSDNSAVCRLHFTDEDVENPRELDYQRYQLKEHAVPTIFGSFEHLISIGASYFKKKGDSDTIESFSALVNEYPKKVKLAENWNCRLINNMLHFFTVDILEDDVNIKNQISVYENLDLSVSINNMMTNVCELECFKSCEDSKLMKWSQLQYLLKVLGEDSHTKKLLYLEEDELLLEI